MIKALFLDRDGVINVDHGYVHKIEDFEFMSGIFDLAREAQKKGYLICVITNQAGIGRGYYGVSEFNHLTDWMCDEFLSQDVFISKVYYSPYHATHGIGKYKQDHQSRKPNPGMINQAVDEFHIDVSQSVLLGDKLTDVQAGETAGVGTNILYLGSDDVRPDSHLSYYTVATLNEVKLFL